MESKVWFITGASRGFGRAWAVAALDRGDRVAATARHAEALVDLPTRFGDAVLPLVLDVTDRRAVVTAVDEAHRHFGRLDVVVSNAGYGLFGAVEEISEAQARAQVEANLFGSLWVVQAALPHLRRQRSGHILQVSSVGGILAFPYLSLYHASKWGIEGLMQSLAAEVRELGIKVTLVEPGAYATDWSTSSAAHAAPMKEYDHVRRARAEIVRQRPPPGDPEATASAVLKLVDSAEPPLRILFGNVLDGVRKEYADRLALWEQWNWLAAEAYQPVPRRP